MKSENILSADILDLIFENRNKNYGAYMLRKQYNGRMAKALAVTFLLATALLLATFVFKPAKGKEILIIDPTYIKLLPEVVAEKPKKPAIPTPPKQPAKIVATRQWVSTIVITPKNTDAGKLKNLDSVAIGSITHTGLPSDKALVKGPEPMESTAGNTPEIPKKVDKETPRYSADVMPVYPGGMEALRKFLQKNLQNPEDMEEGTVIAVKIKFVVGYDGKLKAFETVQDGGITFNNEVIRVLKKMPQWLPGKSNGENVSVYFTIPVKFTAAL